MSATTVKLGDADELGLALLPLSKVSKQIAAWLIAEGNGGECGECEKPFTTARKWRGVVRLVTLSGTGLCASFYLVCGKCRAAAEQRRREGGSVAAEPWRAEARRMHDAARLFNVPAQGTA